MKNNKTSKVPAAKQQPDLTEQDLSQQDLAQPDFIENDFTQQDFAQKDLNRELESADYSADSSEELGEEQLARILGSVTQSAGVLNFGGSKAEALMELSEHSSFDGEQFELAERKALRRIVGLSTELSDVTEVEYRQLRLERVVLIGIHGYGQTLEAENSLRELAALAETAGAEVLDGLLQQRALPDPKSFLGKGKAEELKALVASLGADTVIADTELSPSQRRALEDIVKVKVIDRTAVILDIFSQHAKSREGKAQVELAQLEYLLPRLRGWGESMSRQAGGQVGGAGAGMGSRGPGETKIELDRRRIHTRMAKLKKEIAGFKPARQTMRSNRRKNAVPSVAIAGYTNAGKSSLLNRITEAGVLVENALFATLDPTVRKTMTPDGRLYTLVDTVGFVRQLPHQLVEAFRSSLEEISDSDLVLHLVDASHPDPAGQIHAVREVLKEIDELDSPELVVFNKVDAVSDEELLLLRGLEPKAFFVSAKTGAGIEELVAEIARLIPAPDQELELLIPYHRGELVAKLHKDGKVLGTEYLDQGTKVTALVKLSDLEEFADYQL